MKTIKKLLLLTMALVAMYIFVGCGYTTVNDGATGVVIEDGKISDEWLEAGRHHDGMAGRYEVKIINNRLQYYSYPKGAISEQTRIEGESKEGVIVNCDSYSYSYRIEKGEKSVWLARNVTLEPNEETREYSCFIPEGISTNALKDALVKVEAVNVTKREFVQPIFKEILQERIDEYFSYTGDGSIVKINSVEIGNLSYDPEYDKEVSRTELLRKRAENDTKQADLDKAKAAIDLEKAEAEAAVEQAKARNKAELARIEAEENAAELDVLSQHFSSEEIMRLKELESEEKVRLAFANKWDGSNLSPNSFIADALLNALGVKEPEPEKE